MIRMLKWTDMDGLISNYLSLYSEVGENPGLGIVLFNEKPSYESEVRWFSNLYSEFLSGNALVSIAEEEGRVAGICDVHKLRPGSEVDHNGLLGILIHKDFRGRGIGTALMEDMINQCRGKFVNLRLDVYTSNITAVSLYKKMGFVECGHITRSVKRNGKFIDELVMCLGL